MQKLIVAIIPVLAMTTQSVRSQDPVDGDFIGHMIFTESRQTHQHRWFAPTNQTTPPTYSYTRPTTLRWMVRSHAAAAQLPVETFAHQGKRYFKVGSTHLANLDDYDWEPTGRMVFAQLPSGQHHLMELGGQTQGNESSKGDFLVGRSRNLYFPKTGITINVTPTMTGRTLEWSAKAGNLTPNDESSAPGQEVILNSGTRTLRLAPRLSDNLNAELEGTYEGRTYAIGSKGYALLTLLKFLESKGYRNWHTRPTAPVN